MRNSFNLIVIAAFIFSIAAPCFAAPGLTRAEKASLNVHRSILRKSSFITKKSSLKTLQAKLKQINKDKKAARMRGGF